MKISVQNLKEAKQLKLLQKIEDISFLNDQDLLNLEVDFNIQLVSEEFVLVNGFFTVYMRKQCERCLEEFDYKMKVDFNKEYGIENNQKEIDLSDDVREEFWLNIPLVYLCKKDCKGLCSNCGANLNLTKCDCKQQEFESFGKFKNNDNPLSVLKVLKGKIKG